MAVDIGESLLFWTRSVLACDAKFDQESEHND